MMEKSLKVGLEIATVVAHILAKGYNYIHSHKLARKLGLRGQAIGVVLRYLAKKGYIELYIDRVGRAKVYRVKDKQGLISLVTKPIPDIVRDFRKVMGYAKF